MSADDRVAYWKRRASIAEQQVRYEHEHNEHTLEWARNAFVMERRLHDRCAYLYGLAVKHGATDEELRGSFA